jgi:hypothetical protein
MASAIDNVIIFPLPDLSMLPIGCDSGCIIRWRYHSWSSGLCNYDWQINGVTVSTLQNLGLNPTNMPVYGIPYTITLIGATCNGCIDSTKFEYTPHDAILLLRIAIPLRIPFGATLMERIPSSSCFRITIQQQQPPSCSTISRCHIR